MNQVNKPTIFLRTLTEIVADGRMSKRQLAIRAKISRSHLDKILDGQTVPTLEIADRIADACGESLENMLAGKVKIPA
jgi:transcriptional regulator with XRE-family HTH domain